MTYLVTPSESLEYWSGFRWDVAVTAKEILADVEADAMADLEEKRRRLKGMLG